MSECGERKFNLQLPKELYHPLLLEEFHDGKEETRDEWFIEHFISSLPDAKGPTILCYNPDQSCYEALIIEEGSERKIRRLTKIEKDKFNNSQRIDLGLWSIDENSNLVEPITQCEDRSPNVEQL